MRPTAPAKYEKAIEESEIAIGLDPDQTYGYAGLALANLHLGRFPEVEKAPHAQPQTIWYVALVFAGTVYLAFLKRDQAGMNAKWLKLEASGNRRCDHPYQPLFSPCRRVRTGGEGWQRAKDWRSKQAAGNGGHL